MFQDSFNIAERIKLIKEDKEFITGFNESALDKSILNNSSLQGTINLDDSMRSRSFNLERESKIWSAIKRKEVNKMYLSDFYRNMK